METDVSRLNKVALLAASLGFPVAPAAPPQSRPIFLVTETVEEGVSIMVVGIAEQSVDAHYALETVSGPPGSSNRSSQQGMARLKPGVRSTLVRLRLPSVKQGEWRVRLVVTTSSGAAYQEVVGT